MEVVKKVLRYALLAVLILIFVAPFVWMVLTSFKSLGETLTFPPELFPKAWQVQNYAEAWRSGPFLHYLVNSLVVTVLVLLLQMTTTVLAAYAFACYDFKGKGVLFLLIIITMMIPEQLTFLPIFLMMSSTGLLNTIWSLVLPMGVSAFGTFLLRQRFMQIPNELIEAARLDNASEMRILRYIMLPQAKSTLTTLALFSFISTWNNYFWPLVMTTNDAVRTLPLGVAMLRSSQNGIAWNVLMAGNIILVLPIIIVYLLAHKKIVDAFVYTGIK
ncbi:carbohydrate ABC transporter permease [Peptoniphilus equinus]|uniref:Carbohydrate ABC transporter permease n=1 Tax=Peptoniphilus equinus TaxID=3016343 RepID=A0ABY7QTX8_9FIRM|nr:carbohydrate ABC transporter permease [Peptoniphilus equinus]WBW49916.1 carbohydrate ABC transporter permease [Peptoniphilus equinus]